MKPLRVLTCGLFIFLNISSGIVLGASEAEQQPLPEQIMTLSEALDLTPEQADELHNILQSGAEQRQRTLKKYGISMDDERKARLSFREKRALMTDMQKLKNNLQGRLEEVLSDEQLDAFQERQASTQQAFKEKLSNKLR